LGDIGKHDRDALSWLDSAAPQAGGEGVDALLDFAVAKLLAREDGGDAIRIAIGRPGEELGQGDVGDFRVARNSLVVVDVPGTVDVASLLTERSVSNPRIDVERHWVKRVAARAFPSLRPT
jgi:hypothetical protein